MAVKRRRNAGAPKRRKASTKMRGSAAFKKGQSVAAKLIAGRKLTGSQKKIRQQIHALIRKHGSKKDIDLLEGPIGAGKPPHSFRKGVASVAADVAGFDGESSGRSKAARAVTAETKRDKRDTLSEYEITRDEAMEHAKKLRALGFEKGQALSLGWKVAKGEKTFAQAKKTRKKKGAKANPHCMNPRRKTKRKSRSKSRRRNPVNFYDLY